jgi:hypothetical protein
VESIAALTMRVIQIRGLKPSGSELEREHLSVDGSHGDLKSSQRQAGPDSFPVDGDSGMRRDSGVGGSGGLERALVWLLSGQNRGHVRCL